MKRVFIAITFFSLAGCATSRSLETTEKRAPAAACPTQGVKTAPDIDAVVSCVNRVSSAAAPACAGVKIRPDIDAVVSCVNKVSSEAAPACGGI